MAMRYKDQLIGPPIIANGVCRVAQLIKRPVSRTAMMSQEKRSSFGADHRRCDNDNLLLGIAIPRVMLVVIIFTAVGVVAAELINIDLI